MAEGSTSSIPVYASPASGELAGSASAVQMPNIKCQMVKFKALAGNTSNIYIGISGVTVASTNTNTTAGLQMAPGDDSGWILVNNLNVLYYICSNANDVLTYLVLN